MTPVTNRFTVKPVLTPDRRNRAPRYVDNPDYAAFVTRALRAYGRRVAEGDIESLTELVELVDHLDQAITTAITGLRAHGYSWADIATGLSVSRQAAQQRWGQPA